MDKKFQNISFDLRENLLDYEGRDFERLDHYSLLLISGYYLKSFSIYNKLFKKLNFESDELLSCIPFRLLDNLVEEIYNKIKEQFNSELIIYIPYTKSSIRFVILQAIWFIKTAKIYLTTDEYKDLFVKSLVFTSQGTVNSKKTFTRVIEKVSLPPYPKFRSAAQLYLDEETVKMYFEQLSDEEKNHCLKHIKMDVTNAGVDLACYYWIWRIMRSPEFAPRFIQYYFDANKQEIFAKDYIRDEITIQIMFRRAVEFHEEMAVHYLWTNFISAMSVRKIILKELISKFLISSTHSNVIIYLILNAKEDELEQLFEAEGNKILMLIFKNLRFRVIFFKVLEAFKNHIDYFNYILMLYDIMLLNYNKNPCEIVNDHLNKLFTKMPYSYKKYMLTESDVSMKLYFELLRVPFEKADFEWVEKFLHPCPKEIVCNFLSSYYGLQLLEIAIKNSKYEFVQQVLNFKFDSKTDKEMIKTITISFFEKKAFSLCSDFVFEGIQKLNTFILWLKDEVDLTLIKNFQKTLLSEEKWKILKNMIFTLHKDNDKALKYIEEVLIWCDSEINVESVKSVLSLHIEDTGGHRLYPIKCYSNVRESVLQSRWSFLNDLIIWKKCNDEERKKLGRQLLIDKSLFPLILEKDLNYLYNFYDFLNKVLLIKKSATKMINFKLNVFNKFSLFYPLILEWKLDEIKKAIEWCDPPQRKICEFYKVVKPKLKSIIPNTEYAHGKLNEFLNWLKFRAGQNIYQK